MTVNKSTTHKRTKVTYWICTGFFSLFMLMSALSDLFEIEQARSIMTHLGFPLYLMRFMGVVKILGLVVLLIPRFAGSKEWAYAGFVFNLLGGLYAHLSLNDAAADWGRPLMFLLLLIVSYTLYHRNVRIDQSSGYSLRSSTV